MSVYPTVKIPDPTRHENPIVSKVQLRKRTGRSAARNRILQRDNYTCNMCDEPYPETYLEVDHITPMSLDGPDTDVNKQTLCLPCHLKKTISEREGRSHVQ
jgi:5-methylcytosine-specific restriction endonuclease McrA